MANEQQNNNGNAPGTEQQPAQRSITNPGQQPVDVQVGEGDAFSLDLGSTGLREGENRHAVQKSGDGLTAEVGMGDQDTIRVQDQNLNQDGTVKKPEGEVGQEGDTTKKPEGEQAAADTLPEFDPAKPEVAEAYGKRYLSESGAPDLGKLSADWKPVLDPKTGMPTSGDLPEGTYKFLETKGFSKETVKGIEAGQLALAQKEYTDTFAAFGGADQYKAAQDWAKTNWTEDQKKAYNADRMAGGVRRDNAFKLLKGDFAAANPESRRQTPSRTVTDNSGNSQGMGTTAEPYATKAEWQADMRKARSTNDQKLLNTARERMKASTWYAGQ